MGGGASEPLSSTDANKSATDDFAALLGDEKFCDATLVTSDGREFRVHQAILAARSSVFAAMFVHDMREKREQIVRLPDIEGPVMAETLRYVYAGRVENLKDTRKPLLHVAHKYMLDGLRDMCAKAMQESLSVDNAVDTLVLADLYEIEALKGASMEFIRKNVASVIGTPDFKKLKKSSKPSLLEELYCDLAAKGKV